MTAAVKPTIHLNGTPRERLVGALERAFAAVMDAGQALAACCPNGRDYYPQGDDAIVSAMKEHEERLRKLREVQDDLAAIAEHIALECRHA